MKLGGKHLSVTYGSKNSTGGPHKMTRKIPPPNPRPAYRRQAVAERRCGIGAKCKCGESRPLALIPGSVPTICASCDRRKHGRRKSDDHHIVGEANGPLTMRVPVND